MRASDEMGGLGERQRVGKGGGRRRNQMVLLHNPTPWGGLSKTSLLRTVHHLVCCVKDTFTYEVYLIFFIFY